jgi:hypothetical protein
MASTLWRKKTIVVVWSIIGLIFVARILESQVTNGSGRSRFGADQALRNAVNLCRTIVPQRGCIKLFAEPIVRLKEDGTDENGWKVDCVDEFGASILHLVWNAESGNLRLVECTDRASTAPTLAHLTRAQGRQLAEYWIRALNVFAQDLTIEGPVHEEALSTIWRFKFRAGDRVADIAIEADSGALIEAKMDHTSLADISTVR